MWWNYFSISVNDNVDIIAELDIGKEILSIRENHSQRSKG